MSAQGVSDPVQLQRQARALGDATRHAMFRRLVATDGWVTVAELTAEHERILALAETVADATRHHRPVDASAVESLDELLGRHVAKEEAGLYPLLAAESGEPADVFADLEAEHTELFDTLAAGRFDHLALYALQRHIEEEEEVLFSGALFHFDGDTWDDLAAVHHAIDDGASTPAGVAS